jgi:hypothetical protein
LHDLLLDLETDYRLGTITRRHAGDFHEHGKTWVKSSACISLGVVHTVNMRHAAVMDAGIYGETI